MSFDPVPSPLQSKRGDTPSAIVVDRVSKCYQIYERPEHRLKQAIVPRVQRAMGRQPGRFFRESWALRDVSMQVRRGETVGIIGRNGSGKSTLLQIICGTLTPTAGSVAVRGRVGALLELGSGFNPEFTGRENVYMSGAILGMSTDEIDRKYEAIAAFADIGAYINEPVKTYSSGMYVRLAFAVIAHADADLLVVDEALSVGDVFFGQKCMRFLRDFQQRGTVLFVSHDASSVINLCDRAIWLEDGVVAMDGSAKAVCEAYHASRYGMTGRNASGPSEPDAATNQPGPDPGRQASSAEVFAFDARSAGFGDGRVEILDVRLEDSAGSALSHVSGGEIVRLVVAAHAGDAVARPIAGFFLKDRLGQHLFGTNTFLGSIDQPRMAQGDTLEAVFEFVMPFLPVGRYTFDVAIADGSHEEHVQNAWLYDAVVIESTTSSVATGLVGIPYRSIGWRQARRASDIAHP